MVHTDTVTRVGAIRGGLTNMSWYVLFSFIKLLVSLTHSSYMYCQVIFSQESQFCKKGTAVYFFLINYLVWGILSITFPQLVGTTFGFLLEVI